MEQNPQAVVLVCPLDWGLGHATRCVPVIRDLIGRSCRIVIAADGASLAFLQKEFAHQAEFVRFRGKPIQYPKGGQMLLKMLFQLPGLLVSVVKEHNYLKELVRQTGASIVISDNRYGLWHKKAKTVFITHQLFVRSPGGFGSLEKLLHKTVRFFVKKFDRCWVPDYFEPPGLSGELSHKQNLPGVSFVGPLSRFLPLQGQSLKYPLPAGFPGDFFLVMVSGPEPQRSLFEKLLRAAFEKAGLPVVFVLGKPGEGKRFMAGNTFLMSHANTSELGWLIKNSRMVICRPGYSSIMDLSVFGKKVLLIPTPGQTEQEYLGQMLHESGQAFCIAQHKLNLERDIAKAASYAGLKEIEPQNDLLGDAIDQLLKPL